MVYFNTLTNNNDLRYICANIKHISISNLSCCLINGLSILQVDNINGFINYCEKLTIGCWNTRKHVSLTNNYLCNKNQIIFKNLKMFEIDQLYHVPNNSIDKLDCSIKSLIKFQQHMININPNCPLFIKINNVIIGQEYSKESLNKLIDVLCKWLGSGLFDCTFKIYFDDGQITDLTIAEQETEKLAMAINNCLTKKASMLEHLSAQHHTSIIQKRFKNEYCNNYSRFIIDAVSNARVVTARDWFRSLKVSNCQQRV